MFPNPVLNCIGELKQAGPAPRVLVVDDDECFLSILEDFLGTLGCKSTLAANTAQARRHLKHRSFDAVISSLHMPGESGLDLLRHVSSEYPDTPFILTTAACELRARAESRRMGAFACMDKPFSLTDLLRGLAEALRIGTRSCPVFAFSGALYAAGGESGRCNFEHAV